MTPGESLAALGDPWLPSGWPKRPRSRPESSSSYLGHVAKPEVKGPHHVGEAGSKSYRSY
jgi:hypothetical protein